MYLHMLQQISNYLLHPNKLVAWLWIHSYRLRPLLLLCAAATATTTALVSCSVTSNQLTAAAAAIMKY
jgi:hypothetical protein